MSINISRTQNNSIHFWQHTDTKADKSRILKLLEFISNAWGLYRNEAEAVNEVQENETKNNKLED